MPSIDEEIGETTIERFLGVDFEIKMAMSTRGRHVFRAPFENLIQFLAIKGGDVFHVVGLFHAPFNLEAGDARIHQFLEMCTVVKVFQRQQVAVFDEYLAVGVEQIPWQSTRLGTSTTVCAAVADALAEVATSAVADAQGTMHKELKRHGGLFPDLLDLF